MSRFLEFVVERALEGRGGELKEYLLGVEIFDRGPDFDPRVDPIVRVEARRLRAKLASYYETDGRADGLVIELRTGTYAPCFRVRDHEPQNRTAPPRDIAVLPFTNLSTDPANDYFSDGLTEELIHALTKIEGLRVIAWNSSLKLKDRDVEDAGKQLSVGAVLTGGVRIAGRRLRVTARLVDTSGYCLWSEMYDRQLEDIFVIQEDIARAIVSTLRMKLIGAPAPIARSSSSIPAYTLYLKGRFYWNKRTVEGLERAVQCFKQAVAADPYFAAGHAGVADGLMLMADYGLAAPDAVVPEAEAEVQRSLELDPNLADAHASLGLIRSLYRWRWAEAERHYRRAIELNPGYVSAHHWYACDCLALLGRMDEALPEIELAVRLDPLSPVMNDSLAYVLMLGRRYEESLSQSQKVAELEPFFYKAYTSAGRTYICMGRHEDAIRMLEKGRELAGDVATLLGALGQAYALAGEISRARGILRQLEETAATGYVPSTAFAFVYLGLGERDRALERLEAGCERREASMCGLKVHPGYDLLRGDSRFEALVKKIGLAG